MLNPVTRLILMDEVKKRLSSFGDSSLLAEIDAEPTAAYLGALGVSLGDFLPADPSAPGGANGSYLRIWQQVFAIAAGDGTASRPGLLSIVNDIWDQLDKLDQWAADENEPMMGLFANDGGDQAFVALAQQFKVAVDGADDAVVAIGAEIADGMRPVRAMGEGETVPPRSLWWSTEFLAASHPGRLASRPSGQRCGTL